VAVAFFLPRKAGQNFPLFFFAAKRQHFFFVFLGVVFCASGLAQVGGKAHTLHQAQFTPHLRQAAPDRIAIFISFFLDFQAEK